MSEQGPDWNVPWNSELTTIKHNSFMQGWIWGFIAASGIALIIWGLLK